MVTGIVKKALFTIFLIILLLAGLEAGFRLIPERYRTPPFLLFDRSPVYFQVDEERFHPWSHQAEESRRIVVVGDSFAAGVGVQKTDRFAARLEQMLNVNREAVPFRVDVLARPGTSTYQQVNLVHWALTFDPELVILAICLNDTEDWTNPRELQDWRDKMIPRPPSPGLKRFFSLSQLSGWIYNRIQSLRARRGYLEYYRNLYNPSYYGWKRFDAAISIIRDACREGETELLALIFPLLSDRFEQGLYPFEFAHRAIHELLEREEVNFVDALERFRSTHPKRMTAIPAIDPHPSEIAHRIAAEKLFDRLFELELLDSSYELRCRGSSVLHERWIHGARIMGIPLELDPATFR